MGRRTRMRIVKAPPKNFYFHSSGDDLQSENYITLTIAEFEAMRLKHHIDLPQGRSRGAGEPTKPRHELVCSEIMGVSQPTFSRILESAHKKVTKALIEGKEIRVQGGNVEYKEIFNGYGCLNCFEEWADDLATAERKVVCPKCESTKTYHLVREPL